jgi:hypothetical protein
MIIVKAAILYSYYCWVIRSELGIVPTMDASADLAPIQIPHPLPIHHICGCASSKKRCALLHYPRIHFLGREYPYHIINKTPFRSVDHVDGEPMTKDTRRNFVGLRLILFVVEH